MRAPLRRPSGIFPALALSALLLTAIAASAGINPGRPPGPSGPPAAMRTFWSHTKGSDTLALRARIFFSCDCADWRSEWRIELPEGLELVHGSLGGGGLTREVRGEHTALLRCTRWGTFEVRGWFRSGLDSLNWTSHEYLGDLRVTPDSFEYKLRSPILNEKHVLGGIHHRSTGWVWLPLDPGESETVEPGFDERNQKSPPPALQKASGVLPGAVSKDSSVTVMVRVAVDREGRVKDVYARRVAAFHPPEVIDAAVEAARHWTFTPAKSFGRPASALYSIGVPVALDRRGR